MLFKCKVDPQLIILLVLTNIFTVLSYFIHVIISFTWFELYILKSIPLHIRKLALVRGS